MANTLKKSISPDSPQCEEQCVAIKFQSFTKFSKIYSIYNILLQTIFWTAPHFLTLGVAVSNTINTHEFCLKHRTWLEIRNSITIFRDNLLAFQNSCQLKLYTCCLACIVLTNCKF